MELTILGADGTYPRAHSACSGYLLQHDGFNLWMDAGNGTLSLLQEHISLEQVDAIFVSHAHVDHCADIYPFFYQLINTRKTVPLRGVQRRALDRERDGPRTSRWAYALLFGRHRAEPRPRESRARGRPLPLRSVVAGTG